MRGILTTSDGAPGRRPLNAYVAIDEEPDLQIEVYAPKRGEALRLASAGVLEPLG